MNLQKRSSQKSSEALPEKVLGGGIAGEVRHQQGVSCSGHSAEQFLSPIHQGRHRNGFRIAEKGRGTSARRLLESLSPVASRRPSLEPQTRSSRLCGVWLEPKAQGEKAPARTHSTTSRGAQIPEPHMVHGLHAGQAREWAQDSIVQRHRRFQSPGALCRSGNQFQELQHLVGPESFDQEIWQAQTNQYGQRPRVHHVNNSGLEPGKWNRICLHSTRKSDAEQLHRAVQWFSEKRCSGCNVVPNHSGGQGRVSALDGRLQPQQTTRKSGQSAPNHIQSIATKPNQPQLTLLISNCPNSGKSTVGCSWARLRGGSQVVGFSWTRLRAS